jgi:hypothetical protein
MAQVDAAQQQLGSEGAGELTEEGTGEA